MLFAVATVAFDQFGDVHLSCDIIDADSPESAQALSQKIMARNTRSAEPEIIANAIPIRLQTGIGGTARFVYDDAHSRYYLDDAQSYTIQKGDETNGIPPTPDIHS